MFDPLAHGATPRKKINNKFNPLEHGAVLRSPISKQKGDSWPLLIGKSGLKGALSIADLPADLLHLAERGGRSTLGFLREQAGKSNNVDKGSENDYFSPNNVDRPSSWIKSGANKLGVDIIPRPSTAGQRIASHAAEFAGSLGPWGMIGKGASALNATKLASTGAGIGATSGALQEGGVNPLIADLASTVVAPYTATKLNPKNIYSAFQKIPETAVKVPLKIMGLGPKSLNIEAAQAARDLGIDLPAAALTNSKLTGLADQLIGKAPYFGEKLGQKYKSAENQTKNVLDRIYEQVGPKNTPETKKLINDLYTERELALPAQAKVLPIGTKSALDKIGTESFSPSRQEIALLARRDQIRNKLEPKSTLVGAYEGPTRMTAQEARDAGLFLGGGGEKLKMPLQEARVKALIDQKKSINMDWDDFKGVQEQLKNVHHGIGEDLATYGKTNPEWYKKMADADELFKNKAKREELELLLGDKSTNYATDTLSYNALSKAINDPANVKLLKKELTPEVFENLQKLGTVAKAMAIKNRGIPNPSGTAITGAIAGVLGSIYTPEAIATVIGSAAATKLLTDKKFIDLALKYAEKPNLLNVTPLNKRIKDITGYSAVALNREFQRKQEGGE
jgi:hypothetical protein